MTSTAGAIIQATGFAPRGSHSHAFNSEKGFGFITRGDGAGDMLADQRVWFDVGTNSHTGRTKAINLRLL